MEENEQHFGIVCFIISRKIKMQLKEKKDLCSMEKILWLTEDVKSHLQSFVLEISHWKMLHSRVDQLNQDINWKQPKLYHAGDNRRTTSKSIKLLVKVENLTSILRKKPYGLFGQPSISNRWWFCCQNCNFWEWHSLSNFSCSVRDV